MSAHDPDHSSLHFIYEFFASKLTTFINVQRTFNHIGSFLWKQLLKSRSAQHDCIKFFAVVYWKFFAGKLQYFV